MSSALLSRSLGQSKAGEGCGGFVGHGPRMFLYTELLCLVKAFNSILAVAIMRVAKTATSGI